MMSEQINPTRLRQLDIISSETNFVSAASGLVLQHGSLYVVADNDNYMTKFKLGDNGPGEIITLFPGHLPQDEKERKKLKPDLEVLCVLSKDLYGPHGALLAVPSGSKANRNMGALLPLTREGDLEGSVLPVDFSPIYHEFHKCVGKLNIEGLAFNGKWARFFNRGVVGKRPNTTIDVNSRAILDSIRIGKEISARDMGQILECDIVNEAGLHFTFTDAALLRPDRYLFTAVCEATEDEYHDGECIGSGVGLLDEHGNVKFFTELRGSPKVEGIAIITSSKNEVEVLLVSDPDSMSKASNLYQCRLSLHPPEPKSWLARLKRQS